MEERLFDSHTDLTLEKIGKVINKFIENDATFLSNNKDLIKWTSLPSVFLESKNDKKKFIETVVYIDELFLPQLKKVKMINTLASMLIVGDVAISKMDINSLYVVVDFFLDEEEEDYQKDITIFGTPSLLENVRMSSLYPNVRVDLLHYIIDEAEKQKLDYHKMKEVRAFQKKINSLLKTKTSYEILGTNPYMQISHVDSEKFGH